MESKKFPLSDDTEDFLHQFVLSFTWHHGVFVGYFVEVIVKDILVELTKYSEESATETSASGRLQIAQKREEDLSKETTKIKVKSDENNSLPPPIDEFVNVNCSLVNAFAKVFFSEKELMYYKYLDFTND